MVRLFWAWVSSIFSSRLPLKFWALNGNTTASSAWVDANYKNGILQTMALSNLPRTSTNISLPAAENSLFT